MFKSVNILSAFPAAESLSSALDIDDPCKIKIVIFYLFKINI